MNPLNASAVRRLAFVLDALAELDEAIAIERHAARRDPSCAADLAASLGERIDLHDRLTALIERIDDAPTRFWLRATLAAADARAEMERRVGEEM